MHMHIYKHTNIQICKYTHIQIYIIHSPAAPIGMQGAKSVK